MMVLPDDIALAQNLRATLVAKAEDLALAVGGERGRRLACDLLGAANLPDLPSDVGDETFAAIAIEDLQMWRIVQTLRDYLLTGAMGWGLKPGSLDPDFIAQETLQLLEPYLQAIAQSAAGGYDWTYSRAGALAELLKAGQAWYALLETVDDAVRGDAQGIGRLTADDLALLSGLNIRSVRNLIGPDRSLRSIAATRGPREGSDRRSFVVVEPLDALDWLSGRADFVLQAPRPGVLSKTTASAKADLQPRAQIMALHVLRLTRRQIAAAIDIPEERLRTGQRLDEPQRQALRVLLERIDTERPSNTALAA